MVIYRYEKFVLDLASESGMKELNRLGFEGWKLEVIVENGIVMSQRGFNLTPAYK